MYGIHNVTCINRKGEIYFEEKTFQSLNKITQLHKIDKLRAHEDRRATITKA